jgi:peptide-methionine (S)-S-oxide reductase
MTTPLRRLLAAVAAALLVASAELVAQTPPAPAGLAKATFAGGCFWCMQPPFDKAPGVVSTTVGYTGGRRKSPTYEEVSSGGTGHLESIEVVFDPKKTTYAKLLDVFWKNVDPFDPAGQFCDKGEQYRTAIFVHDEEQRRLAEQSKRDVEKRFGKTASTEIVPAAEFWPAEAYHQKYYEKSAVKYKFYRFGCGRDRRLQELWGTSGH